MRWPAALGAKMRIGAVSRLLLFFFVLVGLAHSPFRLTMAADPSQPRNQVLAMGFSRTLRIGLVALAMSLAGLGARAQDDGRMIVGVIDIELVMTEADAVKAARAQLGEIQADFQAKIKAEENELRTTEQELRQQRAILAPDVFAQRLQEFQRQAAVLGEKVRDIRRTMDEGFDATLQRVQDLLLDEVRQLAEEQDINLVLTRSQFVWARGEGVVDITQEALVRLNRKVTPEMVKIDVIDPGQQQ